eukprot:m.119386 g.119386  ORF g.119386 m.119386 type:complete len:92 (+) comp28733_c0_seq1:480-755(+)
MSLSPGVSASVCPSVRLSPSRSNTWGFDVVIFVSFGFDLVFFACLFIGLDWGLLLFIIRGYDFIARYKNSCDIAIIAQVNKLLKDVIDCVK